MKTFLRLLPIQVFTLLSWSTLDAQEDFRGIEQWEVVELQIALPENEQNPFDQLPLAECRGPNGESFNVSGFYHGGDRYTFRISFPSPGIWSVGSRETNDSWRIPVQSAGPSTLGPVTIDSKNRE